MKLNPRLTDGTFVARLNRFAALVQIQGRETVVHVANSGRLRELFQEGARVLLSPVASRLARKTSYDLSLVDLGHTLVSADARLPNTLVYEGITHGQISELQGYQEVLREQVFQNCRFDLLLLNGTKRCYVEAKSVTLISNGVALFPDAPTTRGQRHVATLAYAVQQGWRAAIVFIVQREDAVALSPNDPADPAFGKVLRWAHQMGVEVYAYGCQVSRQEITLAGNLPVLLHFAQATEGPTAAPVPREVATG